MSADKRMLSSSADSEGGIQTIQLILSKGLGLVWCVLIGLGVAAIVLFSTSPFTAAAFILGLTLVIGIFYKVELGFLLLVFISHSHLSTVLIENHGMPSLGKLLSLLVIVSILARYAILKIRPDGWQHVTLLIALYGVTGLLSMFNEPYIVPSIKTLLELVKDAFLAVIAVLLVRKYSDIRWFSWALISSGTMLGSVALFQYLTNSYDMSYWGLSLAPSHHIIGDIDNVRLSGPYGDPNFFSMFQYIVLPFAFERIVSEKNPVVKSLAVYGFGVIMFTVVLSYSRGGMLGVLVMAMMFVYFYRTKVILITSLGIVGILLASTFSDSNYLDRMFTLRFLVADKKISGEQEGSFQGRKSEMLVAVKIFLDHPVKGVGIGNYEQYYRMYAKDLFIDFRAENRAAHCRYLEILAETGLLGFAAYVLLLWRTYWVLLHSRKRALERGNMPAVRMITTVTISLTGFLVGYIFLHDSWPRLQWLMIGIAFALYNMYGRERFEENNALPDQMTT